jgi:hypothetical protein
MAANTSFTHLIGSGAGKHMTRQEGDAGIKPRTMAGAGCIGHARHSGT